MSPMKIGVMGAGGRMGRELIRAVHAAPGCAVAGCVERPGTPFVGQDAGTLAGREPIGVTVGDDPLELVVGVDAILDFTSPKASVEFAGLAANARIVHVCGTTGLSDDDMKALRAAARHARIVQSGNMSLGVNVLQLLTRKLAEALDADYDVEVVEMHHRMKVDAPSGTALMLGAAAAEGRKVALAETAVRSRDGHTGARRRGDIGFATLRGGNVIGDHTVIFAADGERIELAHKAGDRTIYTRGAIKAALWARDKGPGLYTMADVLGL